MCVALQNAMFMPNIEMTGTFELLRVRGPCVCGKWYVHMYVQRMYCEKIHHLMFAGNGKGNPLMFVKCTTLCLFCIFNTTTTNDNREFIEHFWQHKVLHNLSKEKHMQYIKK